MSTSEQRSRFALGHFPGWTSSVYTEMCAENSLASSDRFGEKQRELRNKSLCIWHHLQVHGVGQKYIIDTDTGKLQLGKFNERNLSFSLKGAGRGVAHIGVYQVYVALIRQESIPPCNENCEHPYAQTVKS